MTLDALYQGNIILKIFRLTYLMLPDMLLGKSSSLKFDKCNAH